MMKRILVGIVLLIFLVSCGGGETTTPEPTGAQEIAGSYTGSFQLIDKLDDIFLSGPITFTLEADGKMTGTAISNGANTRPQNETGTLAGTIIYNNSSDVQFDLIAEFPTAGTYTAKGKGSHVVSNDALSAKLELRNKDDVLLDSFSIPEAVRE